MQSNRYVDMNFLSQKSLKSEGTLSIYVVDKYLLDTFLCQPLSKMVGDNVENNICPVITIFMFEQARKTITM